MFAAVLAFTLRFYPDVSVWAEISECQSVCLSLIRRIALFYHSFWLEISSCAAKLGTQQQVYVSYRHYSFHVTHDSVCAPHGLTQALFSIFELLCRILNSNRVHRWTHEVSTHPYRNVELCSFGLWWTLEGNKCYFTICSLWHLFRFKLDGKKITNVWSEGRSYHAHHPLIVSENLMFE